MRKIIKTAALMLAAVMSVSAVGCSNSTGRNDDRQTVTTAKTTRTVADKVELKSYEFPSFLNEFNDPDMLGIQLYKSFDYNEHVSQPYVQPFEDHECSACIDDVLYVFTDNGYKGLLNSKGEELIKADTYTDIRVCSQGMLLLSRNKELNMPDDYVYFDENGGITNISEYSFNPNELKISEIVLTSDGAQEEVIADEEDEPAVYYELKLPRYELKTPPDAYNFWDKLEQVSVGSIDTAKAYSAYFRAYKDNMYYIIAVDRYCNYSVFSGAYGLIRLKVGESYGESYILNYRDYDELLKMVENFGSSDSERAPGKEESTDHIQIVTGLNSGNTVTYTISADGFCLTDAPGSPEQSVNRYFTLLDKESFVSLVQWVDKVLSAEYEDLEPIIDTSEDESSDADSEEDSLSEEEDEE